jgi:hypothetical protein
MILKQTVRTRIIKNSFIGGINEFKNYHPRTNLVG